MDFAPFVRAIMASLIFSAIGLVAFLVAFKILTWFLPFSLKDELERDNNVAVGVLVGAMMLGLAVIIAAAIHG